MEKEDVVTDLGHELPDHEEAGRQDTTEMHGKANTVVARFVPKPFAWRSPFGKVAVKVEVFKACETEAEHRTTEDEDCTELAMFHTGLITYKESSCSPFESQRMSSTFARTSLKE